MWLDEEIYDKDIERKIKERMSGRVDLQIGKKGVTDSFLREVRNRLEKNSVVKIRILKSFIKLTSCDRRDIAKRIADETGAEVVDIRGYTFILVKKRDKIKKSFEK